MGSKKVITVVAAALFLGMAILVWWNNQRIVSQSRPVTNTDITDPTPLPSSDCTPTFVDGGGPYYKANAPFRDNIAPEENQGQKLVVSGKVLKRDCQTPLAEAVIDIWQANESGNYEDEWYRGQITAAADGSYVFTTVIPQGYGQGTAYRPPHIHFKIWDSNRLVITSQMFLPAARNQQIEEAFIVKLESKTENGQDVYYATHDIVVPE